MKIFSYRLLVLIGLLVLAQVSIFGQSSMAAVIPSGRILEVNTRSTLPPVKIPLSSREPNGFWTSNIDRIKDGTSPAGAVAIQAVHFQARLAGEKTELTVSVFSGSRFREKDDLIATYTLSEGESAVVAELAKYGVVPPKVRMVAVEPSIANIPLVVNETKALSVEVSHTIATLPTFVATITNSSKKTVAAFVWHTMAGKKMLVSGMEHDNYARPIISPGRIYERTVPIEERDTDAGDVTFNIGAVLFTDGSYEGDLQAAANIKSFWYSRKDILSKIIPVLRAAVDAAPARPNPSELIAKIESDKRDVAPETLAEFAREFPKDANFRKQGDGRFLAAREAVFNDVVSALRNLEKGAVGRSDDDVNRALATLTKFFEEWLERVSK